MRNLSIISTGASLLGALLTLAPSAVTRAGTQTSTNAPATNISVFFGQQKALTIEEIRVAAKKLLKSKGHQIEDSFHCAVNICVLGKDAGCAVVFQDLPRGMLYVVEFSAKGDPTIRYAGPVLHRTPRFGEKVDLPEGRKVPVKP